MARGFDFFSKKTNCRRGRIFAGWLRKYEVMPGTWLLCMGLFSQFFVLEAWGRAAAYPFGPRNCVVSFSIASDASRHCDSQLRGKRKVRSAPPTRRSARHMPGVAPSRVQRAVSAGLAAE